MHWNQWLETIQLASGAGLLGAEASGHLGGQFFGELLESSNRELLAICDLRQGLAVCMSPQDGAETSAMAVYDGSEWHDLLYRSNEFTKVEGWQGRAPWLWPIAGRCYAPSSSALAPLIVGNADDDCTWMHDSFVRTIQRHGFARHQAWNANGQSVAADRVSSIAELLPSPLSHASYPFNYRLAASQSISDAGIEIVFRVVASESNVSPMPFALGLHFTFNFSSWWGSDWLQGKVLNLGREAWQTDARAQAAHRVELPAGSIGFSEASLRSAVIPALADDPIRLMSPNEERYLQLSFSETAGVDDGGLAWVSYLDPMQRFYCLEPWVGWPNAINSGQGRISLQPGQAWEFRVLATVSRPQPVRARDSSLRGEASQPSA